MNENAMGCYFTVSQGDTIGVGHRQKLHSKFSEKYPELAHLSQQRGPSHVQH